MLDGRGFLGQGMEMRCYADVEYYRGWNQSHFGGEVINIASCGMAVYEIAPFPGRNHKITGRVPWTSEAFPVESRTREAVAS